MQYCIGIDFECGGNHPGATYFREHLTIRLALHIGAHTKCGTHLLIEDFM